MAGFDWGWTSAKRGNVRISIKSIKRSIRWALFLCCLKALACIETHSWIITINRYLFIRNKKEEKIQRIQIQFRDVKYTTPNLLSSKNKYVSFHFPLSDLDKMWENGVTEFVRSDLSSDCNPCLTKCNNSPLTLSSSGCFLQKPHDTWLADSFSSYAAYFSVSFRSDMATKNITQALLMIVIVIRAVSLYGYIWPSLMCDCRLNFIKSFDTMIFFFEENKFLVSTKWYLSSRHWWGLPS